MKAPPQITIKRGSYLNFYDAPNFGLTVPKKDKKAEVFLTFVIGGSSSHPVFQVSTVLVDRKQAAYALKNFKKVLAKARQEA